MAKAKSESVATVPADAMPVVEESPPFGRFGTQKPVEPGGKVPREVKGFERAAGTGMKRFKIRCDNFGSHAHRYILAADEKAACDCFCEVDGVNIERKRLEKYGKTVPAPELVVTEMAD